MDLTSLFLFCLISLIIGAVLMLLVQYYVFVKYFNVPGETPEQKAINEKYLLPDTILTYLKSPDPDRQNPITAFNLVFQFLFHELRNSSKVRKWFYRKLTIELDELISKTTTGRLFDKLVVRDLDIGAHFPEIRNLRLHNAELHETQGHLESLDLLLDFFYEGNFKISIDADMVLGKKGFLSVRVRHLSGLARLQFTRKPYTHWSLCFLGDPKVEFDIETQFQGRQMQSNVTSLISNQIRKAIRRKHTLPNYKLRYKPFFHKTDEELDVSDIVLDGNMDVTIREISRLFLPPGIVNVFCTLTVTSVPWVYARQQDERTIAVTIDLKIHKAKNQQIGIVFKQTEHCVIVDNIIPNTPATKANFCRGDVLVSIEGKKVTHISHISKIIKGLSTSLLKLRVERLVPGQIKNDAETEDDEIYEDFNDCNISFSKTNDSVQIGHKIRKNSLEKASSDSSHSNTPTNSPRKQDESIIGNNNSKSRSKSLSRGNSETKTIEDASINLGNLLSSKDGRDPLNTSKDNLFDSIPYYQQHSTINYSADSFMEIQDLAQFKLTEQFQYFNVNVFGRLTDNSVQLLGYINIPIANVLAECSESNLGHFIKQYSLMPPDVPNLSSHSLSSLSGFDPNLCFGDVLLSFVWNCSGPPLSPTTESTKKAKLTRPPTEKEESDTRESSKQHDFIRTHFHRSTQCDFCGKKIWLKDAVQCRDCGMCCHKKCINKCQNSTICGPVDASATTLQSASGTTTSGQQQTMHSVEFKVTDVDTDMDYPEEVDETRPFMEQHRQSFSDIISQGIKRVNSANNLAIPSIVSAMNQGSRSLPPSPQHTPRKQSLVNQSTNPFVAVAQKLELLPDDVADMSREQISNLTDQLIGYASLDELMGLAKSSSKNLYTDIEPAERVTKINSLLGKLRIALDCETTAHANLTSSTNDLSGCTGSGTGSSATGKNEKCGSVSNLDGTKSPPLETNLLLQTKGPVADASRKVKDNQQQQQQHQQHDVTRKAFLIGQSEERVQVLSVVMLYLCTGLQHAQGVASQ